MNKRNISLFMLLPLLLSGCEQEKILQSVLLVHAENIFEVSDLGLTKEIDTSINNIKLSLMNHQSPNYHSDGSWNYVARSPSFSDFHFFDFPENLLDTISDSIIVGDRFKLTYTSDGKILSITREERRLNIIKATVTAKTQEENDYVFTYDSYDNVDCGITIDGTSFNPSNMFISNNGDLLSTYDILEFNYQKAIKNMTFKFSVVPNDKYGNMEINVNMFNRCKYVINDVNGSISTINNLNIGDEVYFVAPFNESQIEYVAYAFNPLESFSKNILKTKEYSLTSEDINNIENKDYYYVNEESKKTNPYY